MYALYQGGKLYGPFFSYEDAEHLHNDMYGVIYTIISPTNRNQESNHVWTYDEGWVGRPSPFRPDAQIMDGKSETIRLLEKSNERLEDEIVKLEDEIIDWENRRDQWIEDNQKLREENDSYSRRLRNVETQAKQLEEQVIELTRDNTKSTDDVPDPEFSGENMIDTQEDLHWSQAYPEHYGQGEKEDPHRKWHVIKQVWYEGADEEWQGDLAWGPYPSRERAENVLNIQARRAAELGHRAKFIITEEV